MREGILRGIYRYAGPAEVSGGDGRPAEGGAGRSATILFSGPAWQAAMQARETPGVRLGRGGRSVVRHEL